MCVIVVKNKGAKFPTKEEIQNCCLRNPDGFAMAWNEGGKLRVYKTMSERLFIKNYMAMVSRCNEADTALVLHARIATHGSKGVKNCHCWTGSGLAFAHNGVLSNVGSRKDMTDSETFFRDIFEPVYNACGWETASKVINAIIGNSKFAFVNKEGDVWMFGHYEKHDGCFYSNDSWRGYQYYSGRYFPQMSGGFKVEGVAQPRYYSLEDWFRRDDKVR